MRTVMALMVMPRSRSMSMASKQLLLHVALGHGAGQLDQAGRPGWISRGPIMGDDGEVADAGEGRSWAACMG